jgi:SAM-dependent methyltransferase
MRISRVRFLAMASAAAGTLMLPTTRASAMIRGDHGTRTPPHRGLTYRSVVHEVGEGDTPATGWSAERTRRDMAAIRNDLCADSVKVTGDGVERLTRSAAEAAERGLNVWLEPTLGDVPEREVLDDLAETGRFAERLRRQGADVHFSVGCEFLLFLPGIVPGDDVLEKIENLIAGNFDPVYAARRVHDFTARAVTVARSVFHGPLTYAAADDEEVDWDLFDIVGLSYYGYHRSRSAYIRDLRRHLRPGKPLSIQEFGCGTFEGAPQQGGMGWAVVDYRADPPALKRGRRPQRVHPGRVRHRRARRLRSPEPVRRPRLHLPLPGLPAPPGRPPPRPRHGELRPREADPAPLRDFRRLALGTEGRFHALAGAYRSTFRG